MMTTKNCDIYINMDGTVQEPATQNATSLTDMHLFQLDAFIGSLRLAEETNSPGIDGLIQALKSSDLKRPVLKISWALDKKNITYKFEVQEREE